MFGPDASEPEDFFFSPGRGFRVGFALPCEPAGGRHAMAYAAWIATSTGREFDMVGTGSATRARNRTRNRESSRTGCVCRTAWACGVARIRIGWVALGASLLLPLPPSLVAWVVGVVDLPGGDDIAVVIGSIRTIGRSREGGW